MSRPAEVVAWGRRGGHVPRIGPIGASFRAGYLNLPGVHRGVAGSLQRAAWEAGRQRAKVERGLFPARS
jgi:hypothetical protein